MVPRKSNRRYPSLIDDLDRSGRTCTEGACKIVRHTDLDSSGKVTGLSEVAAYRFLCLSFSPGRDRWAAIIGRKKKTRDHMFGKRDAQPLLTCGLSQAFHRPHYLSAADRPAHQPTDRPHLCSAEWRKKEKSLHKKPPLHVRGLVTTARTTTTTDIGCNSLSIDFALDIYSDMYSEIYSGCGKMKRQPVRLS
jgi:hypothetical protein